MTTTEHSPTGGFDLHRIESATFVRSVDAHESLESTNSRALELACIPQIEMPCLVLTDRQTNGRGRGANRWWSADGALTYSLIIDTDRFMERTSRLSLTFGVAVCEALRQLTPQHDVRLKWPNDVYLNGRKICGILVEIPQQSNGRAVVGVGLNVNNSLASAPADLQTAATSLIDATGSPFELSDVLILVLNFLDERLGWLASDNPILAPRWEELSLLKGKTVYVEAASEEFVGVCQGIDEEGGLLLRTQAGIERITVGIVKSFG